MRWFTRRKARFDMAVYGCLLRGDASPLGIQNRIGGRRKSIRASLARLLRLGVVWSDGPPDGDPDLRYYGLTELALTLAAFHLQLNKEGEAGTPNPWARS